MAVICSLRDSLDEIQTAFLQRRAEADSEEPSSTDLLATASLAPDSLLRTGRESSQAVQSAVQRMASTSSSAYFSSVSMEKLLARKNCCYFSANFIFTRGGFLTAVSRPFALILNAMCSFSTVAFAGIRI